MNYEFVKFPFLADTPRLIGQGRVDNQTTCPVRRGFPDNRYSPKVLAS